MARDYLPDGIPADTSGVDPHDPHDGGGGSSDEARNSAEGEDNRTSGSGSEIGELALPSMNRIMR